MQVKDLKLIETYLNPFET